MKKGIDITKINIKWDSETIRFVTCLDLYKIVISLLKTCRPPPSFFAIFLMTNAWKVYDKGYNMIDWKYNTKVQYIVPLRW